MAMKRLSLSAFEGAAWRPVKLGGVFLTAADMSYSYVIHAAAIRLASSMGTDPLGITLPTSFRSAEAL